MESLRCSGASRADLFALFGPGAIVQPSERMVHFGLRRDLATAQRLPHRETKGSERESDATKSHGALDLLIDLRHRS
jgi:hypothetical protein